MTLEKGTLLEGRYRIEDILGQGGMGFVYRALDESLGVEVAVKENLFTTDDYARQFRMEAVILAGIRHSNLPRVTDHFVIDNMGQYLVMDYIDGNDLRQYLEKFGLLPEKEAIRIGVAACDALAYLHSRKPPILHRDIKLGNIKITSEGQVFLVDFGLAKMGWEHEETMAGARAMTPGYSPPEQYGSGRTDSRSDVYSLGATLYAALTGNIPEDSLLRSVDGLKLTPLREHRPDVSTRLAVVIEKALETSPSSRYQSADEFKKALLDYSAPKGKPLKKESHPDESVTTIEVNLPPQKKSTNWRLLGILGGLLLVIILIGAAWSYRGRFAARLLPFLVASATTTTQPSSTSTPTSLPPSATTIPTAIPTASLPPTQPSVATSTAIPTAPPTDTPAPTVTNLPSATLASTVTQLNVPISSVTTVPVIDNNSQTATPQATPLGGRPGQVGYSAIVDNAAQIMLVNADAQHFGSNPHALTNVPQGARNFDWSPDGKQIVFVSPCQKSALTYPEASLYLLDVETGKIGLPPFKPGGDFDPAWSPDGHKIAFTSLRDGSMQIYVYNIQDSSLTRLTTPGNNIQARYPAWSPDSSQIAYTTLYSGLLMISDMAANGSNKHQVVLSGGSFSEYLPAWSPDGTYLIFDRSNSNVSSPSALVRFDFQTGTAKLLSIPLPAVDAAFSPDGLWVAYESHDTSSVFIDICLLPDGKPQHLVTSTSGLFDPVWRPGN